MMMTAEIKRDSAWKVHCREQEQCIWGVGTFSMGESSSIGIQSGKRRQLSVQENFNIKTCELTQDINFLENSKDYRNSRDREQLSLHNGGRISRKGTTQEDRALLTPESQTLQERMQMWPSRWEEFSEVPHDWPGSCLRDLSRSCYWHMNETYWKVSWGAIKG